LELQRFAFSTTAFSRHSLKRSLRRIAKVGFRGVEIFADKPHAWLDSFGRGDVSKLQKQIESLDLYVSNINANWTCGFWTDAPPEPSFEPSLISRNRALREWRIAYSKKALRLGKDLGASSVSITSGRMQPGVPPEKAKKLFVDGLSRLLEIAEGLKQNIAIDFEPTLYIAKSNELSALLKKINSPYLGANLDLAQVAGSGDDPCAAIKTLKGKIFNIHLADVLSQKHYPRIPGDGDMDFREFFYTLDQTGYSGPLTWELSTCDDAPDEACQRTYNYVRTLLLEQKLVHKKAAPKKKATARRKR
jgi:fructoselysine 3-epimerase